MNTRDSIKPVLEKYAKALKNKANVQGCAIGRKKIRNIPQEELSVTVFVDKKLPSQQLRAEDLVPDNLDGISTDVIESGKFTALPRQEHRPFPGGVSCGHPSISAGTIGLPALKTEKYGEEKKVLLSNAHVIAPHWKGNIKKGDPILQPGPMDGGGRSDKIAELLDWKEISFEGDNYIDAAIAECTKKIEPHVIEVGGYLSLVEDPQVDMKVTKHGRTTGHTEGIILATDADIDISFGRDMASFKDQIVIESTNRDSFSDGGDSGSAVFLGSKEEPTTKVAGLLFAGNNRYTMANRIKKVFDEFELEFIEE